MNTTFNDASRIFCTVTGNEELAEREVLNSVRLAKEQGVLDLVAARIEKSGSGTVVRDEKGNVREINFDNEDPYDDMKVDIKIDGDKIRRVRDWTNKFPNPETSG